MDAKRTAIITGASGGIGSCVVKAFLNEGYNVVATSIGGSQSLPGASGLVVLEGDIAKRETAVQAVDAALARFHSIDVLVTAAGIYYLKPFTEFTTEDFHALASINLLGFMYIAQLSVKQMLRQGSGSVVCITASLADQPISGVNASVSMITKGGLNTLIRSLAIEYARENIRFNAVAPGIVDTPLHASDSKDRLRRLQPMGQFATAEDIAAAVLYVANARQVTGEILHVDGGANAGRW
jgi:NAD(P)-dependent dehydrogenase (short-subunit alcohol dehydrogenase family)